MGLYERIVSVGDTEALEDALGLIVQEGRRERSSDIILRINRRMVQMAEEGRYDEAERLRDLLFRAYCWDGRENFDSYLTALEWERPAEERFYLPRRAKLKQIVDGIQKLEDGELDELFIHMPPRTGKTTLMMMYITWVIGKRPESSNLYSSHSDVITGAFYNGVIEILDDPYTYKWKEIFPERKVAGRNAKEETLNIDRRKRYPSFTSRSLYGSLNGSCDCNGVLVSDDLIGGIEEALNRDRLVSAWMKVDNNLIPRAKEHAKLLWCGTRWSMIDPAGLRMDLLENDPKFVTRRYEVINRPALNDNDESNFDYDYGVGFSTEYYLQRRASYERNNDMASWLAQYMGEPVEREGTLFEPNDMNYYNGELPMEEPDRKYMIIDPAFGGGDYVAGTINYQYGDDIYLADVVYDRGEKNITQPLIAKMAAKYDVDIIQIEATKTTEAYAEGVVDELANLGKKITVRTKPAPITTAKRERIIEKAYDVREHMIFLQEGKRSKPYSMFMQNVFSFKITGKNKNDDAPDALSMTVDFAFKAPIQKISVFKRPF